LKLRFLYEWKYILQELTFIISIRTENVT